MNRSFIFLAEGFEEIEALTVIDVMRRAGMDIKSVAVTHDVNVTGAHGITVKADLTLSETEFDEAEWLIVPGGMPGSTNLSQCEKLNDALKAHAAKGGGIAAICAAPAVVLYPLGILDGKEATCYPAFEKDCVKAVMRDAPVVALPNLITANGPASALRFALSIVAASMGEHNAQSVGSGMLFYPKSVNFYF